MHRPNDRFADRRGPPLRGGGVGGRGIRGRGGGGVGGRGGGPASRFHGGGSFNSFGGGSRELMAGANLQKPRWDSIALEKFQKDFYIESPIVSARSDAEIQAFMAERGITVHGQGAPRPLFSFADCPFPEALHYVLNQQGWQNPTPIQCMGFPLALSGRNMVGIAQTGSGKTAAFLLPALVHIAAQPQLRREDGPICLVMVPTRELAQQVQEVANTFGLPVDIRNACVYGGSSKMGQIRDLERRPGIVIATPGRLLDLLETNKTNLRRCTYLVLDEADRMLDMGFEPQIRRIVDQVRPDRQTLMWSATWPREVQSLARDYLRDFVKVTIGSQDLAANPNITQHIQVCQEWEKERLLHRLLPQLCYDGSKVLVFAETKRRVDEVARQLQHAGYAVLAIHGDKQQSERERVLAEFKCGRTQLLVATDVASRGLDIDDIAAVVNVDFPSQIEDYIHRIGRTARSQKTGTSFSFFTAKHMKLARDLIDLLARAGQEINPKLFELCGASQDYIRSKTDVGKQMRDNRRATELHGGESFAVSGFQQQHQHQHQGFAAAAVGGSQPPPPLMTTSGAGSRPQPPPPPHQQLLAQGAPQQRQIGRKFASAYEAGVSAGGGPPLAKQANYGGAPLGRGAPPLPQQQQQQSWSAGGGGSGSGNGNGNWSAAAAAATPAPPPPPPPPQQQQQQRHYQLGGQPQQGPAVGAARPPHAPAPPPQAGHQLMGAWGQQQPQHPRFSGPAAWRPPVPPQQQSGGGGGIGAWAPQR